MKRNSSPRLCRPAFLLTAVSLPLVPPTIQPVHAWPNTSPSARSAAKLKYHPPRGWINHYLPDDRYKVAGGTWKYVSTETDSYYHRPDSSYILQQPAETVIGFSSAADAEEAGYRPGPSITSQDRQTGHINSPIRANGSRTNSSSTGFDVPMSGEISILESEIPKPIRAFRQLVNGVADSIDSTSSKSELRKIKVEIRQAQRDFLTKSRSYVSYDDSVSMSGTLGLLSRAASEKLNYNPDFDPGGVKRMLMRQVLNAARRGADDLIPQIKEIRRRQSDIANEPLTAEGMKRISEYYRRLNR